MSNPLKNFNYLHAITVALAGFVAYAQTNPTPLYSSLAATALGVIGVLAVFTHSALTVPTPTIVVPQAVVASPPAVAPVVQLEAAHTAAPSA